MQHQPDRLRATCTAMMRSAFNLVVQLAVCGCTYYLVQDAAIVV